MAGSFPTLKSGNTVFYPLKDTQSFSTGVLHFLDDTEQRWRRRKMLRRFTLSCNNINAYDVSTILNFLRSQFGRFDSTWSLTIGGNTYSNLALDTDSYQVMENMTNRLSLSFNIVQVLTDNPTIPSASPYFPQLANGTMTVLPYQNSLEYRTTLEDSTYTGRRFAWKWRTAQFGKSAIKLQNLTATELSVVKNFFYSMEGRKGEFTLLDPGGNLAPYSDDFSNAAWGKSSVTVGSAQTDPYHGNLATRLTSSGSNGQINIVVLPNGNAFGFQLCASAWVRAASSGQTLSMGFLDAGLSVLGTQVWSLAQGVWQRIYCPITLATNSSIRIAFGGASTWGSGKAIDFFSASCVAMPGPGPRLLTPGMDALRSFCRFDTDDFAVNYEDYGKTSVDLPIAEYSH